MVWPRRLGVELEQHDVAVLHDVVFAFVARLAGLLGGNFATERDEVVIGDRLCADEAALEVGVDNAGRLRCPRAAFDRPGARFLRPGGKVGNEVEQVVTGADQPVEARFVKAKIGEELRRLDRPEAVPLRPRWQPRW